MASGTAITESVIEDLLLEWFGSLGYEVLGGPDIAPREPTAERADYREVLLLGRLEGSLRRLNPGAPDTAIAEAIRQLRKIDTPNLVANNWRFHRMLVDGIEVELPASGGGIRGHHLRLLDFEDPGANDWLAVNQFTVQGTQVRRPDVVVFVNGIPLAVVELKDPTDEQATIWKAHNQLQTYKHDIPALFVSNEVLVVSDGVEARLGSLTAPKEWFLPWRTVTGDELAGPTENRLEVLAHGVFDKERFLDLVRHFVTFEDDRSQVRKVIAGYH